MQLQLSELVSDFADALAAADASRSSHKKFQPGIGPFGETDAVRTALAELKKVKPRHYTLASMKRLPDLLIPGEWAIEFKIVRPFGDNGKPAEHWSENVLHPYPGNTSSLGDCLKLRESALVERKCVVIFGYEHTPPIVALEPAIAGFELLAREVVGPPQPSPRTGASGTRPSCSSAAAGLWIRNTWSSLTKALPTVRGER
jgi:hypothetical protein